MKKVLSFLKTYNYLLLVLFVILGIFDSRIALTAIICMVGPLIFALFGKGRFWCGNLCPRGLIYDKFLSRVSKKKAAPKFLRSKLFRASVILIMFSIFGFGIYKNLGDIWGIGMVFYRMIVITTLIGVILSFFFNHRSWCNFCPMGSIASLITYTKKVKNTFRVSSGCSSCKLCERRCPMDIAAYKYKGKVIEHPDCIQCGICKKCCPRSSIK